MSAIKTKATEREKQFLVRLSLIEWLIEVQEMALR
jgi:hypothetical protein